MGTYILHLHIQRTHTRYLFIHIDVNTVCQSSYEGKCFFILSREQIALSAGIFINIYCITILHINMLIVSIDIISLLHTSAGKKNAQKRLQDEIGCKKLYMHAYVYATIWKTRTLARMYIN
jgi:hypothetical protein